MPIPRESHTTNRRAQGDLPISGMLLPETVTQLAIASPTTYLPYQHQVGLPDASLLHSRTHWFREANLWSSALLVYSIPLGEPKQNVCMRTGSFKGECDIKSI